MRTTTRVAAILLTTTIVAGGTAASASAQVTTLKDKASDVLSFADQTTDERGTRLSYSESVASGVDLRSLKAEHTKKSLSVSVKFADLSPEALLIVSLRLDGKRKPSRFLIVSGDQKASVIDATGKKQCSAGVSGRLGASGYVKFVAQRSCLDDPKRIKVSAFVGDQGLSGDDTPYKGDSLSPTSVRGEGWTTWLRAG